MEFCISCNTWSNDLKQHRDSGEHELIMELRDAKAKIDDLTSCLEELEGIDGEKSKYQRDIIKLEEIITGLRKQLKKETPKQFEPLYIRMRGGL